MKMRILVLHSRYLSGDVSGENRVVADEVALLRAGGHEVIAFEPSTRVHMGGLVVAQDSIWSMVAAKQVRQLIDEFRPDVVHMHALFPSLSPAAIIATADSGVPIVSTLHNFRLLCLPATLLRKGGICEDCLGRSPWRGVGHACYRGSRPASAAMATSLILHRALGTFDRVALFLAVTEFVKRKHVEAGFDADRIIVKANFASAQAPRRGAGGAFLVLGRLSGEKGIGPLLKSWKERSLDIVGDGPDRERLMTLAPPSVTFHSSVPANRVPDLLRGARALLMPSRCYEGQPRAVLEAFAAGVPVIASRIGGLPEAVQHGVNGLLVDVDDHRGWSEATERLMQDAESKRLGEGAYQTWKERFKPELALTNLEGAYQTVTRTTKPR